MLKPDESTIDQSQEILNKNMKTYFLLKKNYSHQNLNKKNESKLLFEEKEKEEENKLELKNYFLSSNKKIKKRNYSLNNVNSIEKKK